jgi:hypothetical protein
MAFQYAKLINIQFMPSGSEVSGGLLYQHNSTTYPTASYIREVVLYNSHASSVNVSLFLSSSGAPIGSSSCFYFEPITSGSTRLIEFTPPGMMLTGSDSLHGGASLNDKVTVMAFGGVE